jgi:hypothetical protein
MNSVSLVTVSVGCLVLWRNGRSVVVLTLIWFIVLSALFAFVVSTNRIDVAPRYLLHVSVVSLILIGSTCMWQKPARWWIHSGVLGIVMLGLYLYSGATFALQSPHLHPDWRTVATFLREEEQPNEPIVVLGWDATPIQFYLPDHMLLTSYDFETALQKRSPHPSYLLVQSESSRMPSLPNPASELWQNPVEHVSILRYIP